MSEVSPASIQEQSLSQCPPEGELIELGLGDTDIFDIQFSYIDKLRMMHIMHAI